MTTREQLISTTSGLIRRKGYFGTGINEVIAQVGVPKGSLYHHFPGGKDELIIAALEQAAMERAEMFKMAMKGKGSAASGLIAVVDIFIQEASAPEPLYGCPLSTVVLDIAGDNEKVRTACVELFDFWIESIRKYLDYKEVAESRRKAESFLTRLEGALLLSKARKSSEPLKVVQSEIESLINT